MRRSYFVAEGQWLKGNLHSHTTVSDGVYTPEEMAADYAARDYDFISMTDHNVFVPHPELEGEGLLMLTGVEHDLAYSRTKCIHVVGTGRADQTKTGYDCRKYPPEELTDQQLIDLMADDGQFVALAHPIWSRMEPEEVAALVNFHAIEVFNNGCENLCHAGHGEVYWDMLLRRGHKVYGTASDDTHRKHDAFGGWVMVKAKEKNNASILEALFSGQFYASSGPEILDFGLDGDRVYVTCSSCREIHFVSYPPRGQSQFAPEGGTLTEGTYTLKGGEHYIRIECIDHAGRAAWTNPIFFDARKG
ncbi:MAG: CehA/McbA family metallohydrolase [Oscillospiraceae bacterium]|nr:CehA/McbA family metallohydrolase [Oscillospiraceae bacterium]